MYQLRIDVEVHISVHTKFFLWSRLYAWRIRVEVLISLFQFLAYEGGTKLLKV